jgi:hypothetical protein
MLSNGPLKARSNIANYLLLGFTAKQSHSTIIDIVMAPTPSPWIKPFLTDAQDSWDKVVIVLGWFSRLVETAYAYSDMVVKMRQKKVDKEYKIKKAEKEAYRIMREQTEKRKNGTSTAVKRDVNWMPTVL